MEQVADVHFKGILPQNCLQGLLFSSVNLFSLWAVDKVWLQTILQNATVDLILLVNSLHSKTHPYIF